MLVRRCKSPNGFILFSVGFKGSLNKSAENINRVSTFVENEEPDDKSRVGGVRLLRTLVQQNSETPCDILWFKFFLFIMMDPVINNNILHLFRALWARPC